MGDVDVGKISKLTHQLYMSVHNQNLISLGYASKDFVIELGVNSDSIWNVILKKLEFFLDNRPTENVMLFEIIRALIADNDLNSTHMLQWAMFITQLKERLPETDNLKKLTYIQNLKAIKNNLRLKHIQIDLT